MYVKLISWISVCAREEVPMCRIILFW